MLKMLIADDEPVIIRGLQMLIDWAQLGIEICATCENGADALREIFAQSPDLALLDISMPGKTGIEILKALHTAQSRTKVIFISGFQDFSYAHDALSYGAVDYLLKPVKHGQLLRCVQPRGRDGAGQLYFGGRSAAGAERQKRHGTPVD